MRLRRSRRHPARVSFAGLVCLMLAALCSACSGAQAGRDVGSRPDQLAPRTPTGPDAPLLIVSESDDTIRSLDAISQPLSAPLGLGAGPHIVSVARGSSMLPPQVYVANAGDGTVSVLDA